MTGSLLISLDCEGKWGFADDPRILDDDTISDASLRDAYDFLFRSLDDNGLCATFAVVGLFVAGRDRTEHHVRSVADDPTHRRWLAVPRAALESGRTGGWFFEDLPARVLASGRHELASHGYSHLPFDFPGVDQAVARRELQSMHEVSVESRWGIESMVYPRNAVAHTELLAEHGIRRYRSSIEPVTLPERVRSLVGEFYVHAAADPGAGGDGQVSPGRLVNWRSGPRRVVPFPVTLRRWRGIMSHAAASGGCAHLWFHPHNLVTGHRQRELVGAILASAGGFVRRGELRSLTFRDAA